MKTSFPKDAIRVVLLEGIHPRAAEIFQEEGFKVEMVAKALEGEALREMLRGGTGAAGTGRDGYGAAHVLGIRSKTTVTTGDFAGAPRLLGVGCFCIGTNQVDLADACGRGVPVFNSPFGNTRSVAELTVAEVVALFRRLTDKSERLHRGEWDKSAAGAHEVRGKTLGIVGYGHIGSQVSVLAEAMGMRVVYYDNLPRLPLGNARAVRSLDELLGISDAVTLHVPATEATEGMMGPERLARMKRGAFLINNARGGIVVVPALADALKEGRLGGAAVDVFPIEPAGKDERFRSELCGLRNVILTPHVGGSTEEAQEAIAEDVATKLVKFINNGSTTGAVNVPEVELPEQGREDAAGHGPRPDEKARRHRILHFHRNVPGVLSRMHGLIAEVGANVAAEYLRTNEQVGYVVLDVDPTDGEAIVERLRNVPETIRVRLLW